MAAIFYKKLFEIQLYHESTPGIISADFGLEPTMACQRLLRDYHMVYRTEPGKLTVYYSGDVVIDEDDENIQTLQASSVPANGTAFTFIAKILNPAIARNTKISGETDLSVTDKSKAIPWRFVKPGLVSLQFPETAQTKANELFIVKNENNDTIYQTYIQRNGDGICNCTADLTLTEPGILSFAIASDNTLTRKYYVDTNGELSGNYGFFRVVKDNTWKMPDAISPPPAMPDYNIFQYTFEKL
jgi:hypothetical protein